METLVSFGEWVRRRREALDLTRPELAACAGCSVSALRKIEADERRPSRQLAELLAGCLQLTAEEQPRFLEAARGVRPVARLGAPAPQGITAVSRLPSPVPPGPEARSSPAGACWNLPAPATPLVGREVEMASIAALLDDPGCRLLTLVGPGGIGKTRLAIEVACNVWPRFPDGVFFAPLEATNVPELMAPAVARAVGLSLSGPSEPGRQLMSYLRDRQMLLLLDNVEHLLAGVGELASWLAGAPGLKLLVTSQERLELSGEWVFEVQGLPAPGPDEVGEADEYSAFRLFMQRAQRAKVDCELSAEERRAVMRICQLVEGMPLAIELAAAWIPVLSCIEIAAEIEHGLDILATRLRDLPERQRSMRAVFDHSWSLLNDSEREVLRRLAIFRGGFRREAAQAVAGADLDVLSRLVAGSFLRRTNTGRYTQHVLVRQYAAGRLAELSEEEETAARDRHSAHYGDLLAGIEEALTGTGQLEGLLEIDAEIENIRAGWHWAVDRRQIAAIGAYTGSLMHFYHIRGWHEEAVQMCTRAIAMLEKVGGREAELLIARLQSFQAGALQYLGQIEAAEQLLEASLDWARRLDSPAHVAHALLNLGGGAVFKGDAQVGMEQFQEALQIYESLDDYYGRVSALQSLGWAALTIDDAELAQAFHHRSLPLLREHGPPSLLGWTLFELGAIRRDAGDYEEARQYLEEARATCEKIGYHFALLSCLQGLGVTAELVGQVGQAQSYYGQAAALRNYLGDVPDIATSLALLVRVTLALGDEQQAERTLRELRAFSERAADAIVQGCCEYAAAEIAFSRGELEAAGDGFRQSVSSLRPTRRRALAILGLLRLGQLYSRTGDDDRAGVAYQDALQEARARGSVAQTLAAIVGLGAIFARQGKMERAAEIAALARWHPASSWVSRQQAGELLDELARALPEGSLAAAVERGRERPLPVVVVELLPGEHVAGTAGYSGNPNP